MGEREREIFGACNHRHLEEQLIIVKKDSLFIRFYCGVSDNNLI